eukprot:1181404-Prorocentrum_minimum.AAC.2
MTVTEAVTVTETEIMTVTVRLRRRSLLFTHLQQEGVAAHLRGKLTDVGHGGGCDHPHPEQRPPHPNGQSLQIPLRPLVILVGYPHARH